MESIIVKREYGTAYEMSNKNRVLPFVIILTKEQFNKVKNGVVPMEMGDRWFIFYENETLNFHWWSGPCIYKIKFIEHQSYIESREIIVVSDERVKPFLSDTDEFNELKFIIKYSLLSGEDFQTKETAL